MAKEQKNEAKNKLEDFAGCKGEVVAQSKIFEFLEDVFTTNFEAENEGRDKFAACVWGHPGTCKTALVKSFKGQEVMWEGKKCTWDVKDVPIAQFEEMGDILGMPSRVVYMVKGNEGGWVPFEDGVVAEYQKNGYDIDSSKGVQTHYSAPSWVPKTEGPCILLLDDWNRASIRIIKGCMQLLQNHGTVAWTLPKGCQIVLTGNPDEQDYLVSSIDSAIVTRLMHITLRPDVKEWAVWAAGANVDSRVINFMLAYPEMALGSELTNYRTLTEFGYMMKRVKNVMNDAEKVKIFGKSLLDIETLTAFVTFSSRTLEDMVEPEDVFEGKEGTWDKLADLMSPKRKEKRTDIIAIVAERVFGKIAQESFKPTKERVANFHKFITQEYIPEDMRHSLCRRIAVLKNKDSKNWIVGNEYLRKLILDTIR